MSNDTKYSSLTENERKLILSTVASLAHQSNEFFAELTTLVEKYEVEGRNFELNPSKFEENAIQEPQLRG